MNIFRKILAHLLLLVSLCATAQVQKEFSGQKIPAERDREYNYFYDPRRHDDHGSRKMKQMSRNIYLRDDMLWHVETANVSYRYAGNVSLLSASRYGLTDRLELSTYLVQDVIRPSLFLKSLWKIYKHKWFISSRFDVANAYPGMSLAQSYDVSRVIGPEDKIPLVFEVGHELLVSRAFYEDQNCSDGSAYLIFTGGLGTYWGINCNRSAAPDLPQVNYHFITNRAETLTGQGFRLRFKFWADGRLSNRFYARGGVFYHVGSFTKHHALEMHVEGEFFFSSRISLKAGFLTSFASYTDVEKHAAIWPLLDFTYYFGKKRLRSSTLFDRGVMQGSYGL